MKFVNIVASLAALAFASSVAYADETPDTLSVHLKSAPWASRFNRIFDKQKKPNWLASATESEPVPVTMDGKPYTVLLACKKHDCSNHQLVVLFDETHMYGLRFETTDNSPKEQLTWLNIGGGPESIDGKTILYAAITGSLFNHRQAFYFR